MTTSESTAQEEARAAAAARRHLTLVYAPPAVARRGEREIEAGLFDICCQISIGMPSGGAQTLGQTLHGEGDGGVKTLAQWRAVQIKPANTLCGTDLRTGDAVAAQRPPRASTLEAVRRRPRARIDGIDSHFSIQEQ